MASKIVIIDYGSGNLQSVLNALESVKTSSHFITISNNPDDLKSATHIILPGVGAFGDCISSLKAIYGMVEELQIQVLKNKKPFLGICVGMQLLADFGFEYGKHSGLGFVAGDVVEIDNQNNSLKVPHIGWNNITIKNPHPILEGIKDGEHFYFVHSFHFVAKNQNDIAATVDYGSPLTALITKDNIIATQFHPEKSSDAGLKILKNFISSPYNMTNETLPKCPECSCEHTYEADNLYVCPECFCEWSKDQADSLKEELEESEVIKDANGVVLRDGDTVTVIKDLKVKGSSLVVKVGTKVKNIRLIGGDHDIDCKIPGIGAMKLKSEFVKKV